MYIGLRKFIIKKINDYYIRNPIRLGKPGLQVDETKLNHNVKSNCDSVKFDQLSVCVLLSITAYNILSFKSVIS